MAAQLRQTRLDRGGGAGVVAKEEKAGREEDVILSVAKQSEESLYLSFIAVSVPRRLVIFAPTAAFL
jgi:hypothetical protein